MCHGNVSDGYWSNPLSEILIAVGLAGDCWLRVINPLTPFMLKLASTLTASVISIVHENTYKGLNRVSISDLTEIV